MKNLANILRKADITPRDRILTLVKNDVEKDKTGKGILSDSEIYSLTQGWKPKNSQEVNEYNKYLNLSKLETSMRLDAQMLACRSENILLRSHILLDHIEYTDNLSEKSRDTILDKYIPHEEVIDFTIKNAYLDYTSLIHSLTFNNLPEDIKNDLILLDEYVAHDKKYMEDEVLLYELFKDSKTLSIENKHILINRIYSCLYHDGFRKIKNGTEKDGFLLLHFFAELPMEAVLMKWTEYAYINVTEKDKDYILDRLEEYAKGKNQTMEMIIKETLLRWIGNGLFTKEYTPIFFSDEYSTWNGNTQLAHRDIFTLWYEEIKKTKIFIDKLISDSDLITEDFDKDIFGITERIRIVTGESLYGSRVDIDFIKEFKEQVTILLPLAGIYLFIKKYNKPLNNHETLKSFYELSKTLSGLFDVDMTNRYSDFLKSFKQEIKLINQSMAVSIDNMNSFLHTKNIKKYPIYIKENSFIFDVNSSLDKAVEPFIDSYRKEIEKIGFII
jgi:hypothetical protein